ncbi:unnamed protein product [Vitrella brassicaformis CCMP3155]|uniref:Prolyl endopeptidase n=2 Tax=Vitrella brassicaformis TaxID=1169539 RepID=A0A0G4H5T7_VITBC|nr:unnamed protein product [Vitrella brassicaformis CCMP3155]|eukprot:CEM39208.1 unnamed protein product [Vitrella brassicaformis CCMP3155]
MSSFWRLTTSLFPLGLAYRASLLPFAEAVRPPNPNHPSGFATLSSSLAGGSCRSRGLLTMAGGSTAAAQKKNGLVPRRILFGNPVKTQPRISPDGKRLAYLAESAEGLLNVFVRDISGDDKDRQVTADTVRGIRQFRWAENSEEVLYIQDKGGDENFHVRAASVTSKEVQDRDLTPFEGVKAEGLFTDKHHREEILIGLNIEDRTVFDMYRVHIGTGDIKLDTKNPGDVLQWLTDDNFKIRGCLATDPSTGDQFLRVREKEGGEWKTILTWSLDDSVRPMEFTKDGSGLYTTSSLGRDTEALIELDASTGETRREIFSNDKADVGAVNVDEDTREVTRLSYVYDRRKMHFFDKEEESDYKLVEAHLPDAEASVVSEDHSKTKWVVAYTCDDGPVAYHLFDRTIKTFTYLFENQPELNDWQLAKMEPVIIKTRDGLDMVSYLTLPPGHEVGGRVPLVLLVHGGPWARDYWGYQPQAQWFATRGYACLQVNYRGSTGFGKNFVNAGDEKWGAQMQDDLTDAVKWAIDDRKVADPDRVAIFGGSYGGYAVLAGLTFTPDLYRCGVDIVGVSEVKKLIESIPPYWKPMKMMFTKRVGDVENNEEFNKKISPYYHVDKIKVPLMIGQGANDPRVPLKQSDIIVDVLKGHNVPVEYVVFPDEGHGFARPQNRLDFYALAEQFLARYLDGKAEPYEKVEGSTAKVTIFEGNGANAKAKESVEVKA